MQPSAVGDPVPALPLFLDPDWYVTIPLEDTYRSAWPEVPPFWQRVLEG